MCTVCGCGDAATLDAPAGFHVHADGTVHADHHHHLHFGIVGGGL